MEEGTTEIALPLKPLPSESELRQELDACTDRAMAERLRRKLRVIGHVGSGPTCAMPAWIWRVGRSIIVGQPNEAYSLLQQALRERDIQLGQNEVTSTQSAVNGDAAAKLPSFGNAHA